jgi:hypothetical protein
MNRAQNWQIAEPQANARSTNFTKRDSTTLEFPITVPAAGQTKVTYSVRYTW